MDKWTEGLKKGKGAKEGSEGRKNGGASVERWGACVCVRV